MLPLVTLVTVYRFPAKNVSGNSFRQIFHLNDARGQQMTIFYLENKFVVSEYHKIGQQHFLFPIHEKLFYRGMAVGAFKCVTSLYPAAADVYLKQCMLRCTRLDGFIKSLTVI